MLTNIAPALEAAKHLAYINGVLALFNLIPGFPLDGGRVFRAIVWGRKTPRSGVVHLVRAW